MSLTYSLNVTKIKTLFQFFRSINLVKYRLKSEGYAFYKIFIVENNIQLSWKIAFSYDISNFQVFNCKLIYFTLSLATVHPTKWKSILIRQNKLSSLSRNFKKVSQSQHASNCSITKKCLCFFYQIKHNFLLSIFNQAKLNAKWFRHFYLEINLWWSKKLPTRISSNSQNKWYFFARKNKELQPYKKD